VPNIHPPDSTDPRKSAPRSTILLYGTPPCIFFPTLTFANDRAPGMFQVHLPADMAAVPVPSFLLTPRIDCPRWFSGDDLEFASFLLHFVFLLFEKAYHGFYWMITEVPYPDPFFPRWEHWTVLASPQTRFFISNPRRFYPDRQWSLPF